MPIDHNQHVYSMYEEPEVTDLQKDAYFAWDAEKSLKVVEPGLEGDFTLSLQPTQPDLYKDKEAARAFLEGGVWEKDESTDRDTFLENYVEVALHWKKDPRLLMSTDGKTLYEAAKAYVGSAIQIFQSPLVMLLTPEARLDIYKLYAQDDRFKKAIKEKIRIEGTIPYILHQIYEISGKEVVNSKIDELNKTEGLGKIFYTQKEKLDRTIARARRESKDDHRVHVAAARHVGIARRQVHFADDPQGNDTPANFSQPNP